MAAEDASAAETSPAPQTPQPDSLCWICLEPHSEANPLSHPCSCPRASHGSCLSRWQLQSAGKSEETNCRFCKGSLPHWSESLGEPNAAVAEKKPSHIIMGIKFKGKTYKVKFEEGVVGAEKFKQEVRRVLQLPDTVEIDANFIVCHPQTGERLCLSGFRTYEAAAQLAAMNAAKRCSRSTEGSRPRAAATQPAGNSATNDPHPAAPFMQRFTQGLKHMIRASSGCVLFGK